VGVWSVPEINRTTPRVTTSTRASVVRAVLVARHDPSGTPSRSYRAPRTRTRPALRRRAGNAGRISQPAVCLGRQDGYRSQRSGSGDAWAAGPTYERQEAAAMLGGVSADFLYGSPNAELFRRK